MLIKIQSHFASNEWIVIENAKDVRYSPAPFHFTSAKELQASIIHLNGPRYIEWYTVTDIKNVHEGFHNLPQVDFKNFAVTLNLLQFTDVGQNLARAIWFDGAAYLCNDTGRTFHSMPEAGFVEVPAYANQ